MIPISMKLIQRPPSAERIDKYIRLGLATGLTKTAKEGQEAVQGAVRSSFTYRNNWLPQSNKFGIKVKVARAEDLSAEVRTLAGWLAKQKIGGSLRAGRKTRTFPYTFEGKEYIARPSRALRPTGSKKVLKKHLWPQNLKKPFILRVKNKNNLLILFQRYGPGKRDIEAMYILDQVIDVKPKDAFFEPIHKVVKRRLNSNVSNAIESSLIKLASRPK